MGHQRKGLRSVFASTPESREAAIYQRIESLGSVTEINNDDIHEKVLKSAKPTLMIFTADWCEPCRRFLGKPEPHHHNGGPDFILGRPRNYGLPGQPGHGLYEIQKQNNGRLNIVVIDIMKSPELKNTFNIIGVPTIILHHRGQFIRRDNADIYSNRADWVFKNYNRLVYGTQLSQVPSQKQG